MESPFGLIWKISFSMRRYLSLMLLAFLVLLVLNKFDVKNNFFSDKEKCDILSNGHSYDTYSQFVQKHYNTYDNKKPGSSFIDRIIYLELKHRLPELLLMRVDKMAMATSVETRVPYLDHELVQFVLAIPSNLKYKGGSTKYILKEAARGLF